MGGGLRARGRLGGVRRRSGLVARKLGTYYGLGMARRVRSAWHWSTGRARVGVMSGLLGWRHGCPVKMLMAALAMIGMMTSVLVRMVTTVLLIVIGRRSL